MTIKPCPHCGGPQIQLFMSLACKNECDIAKKSDPFDFRGFFVLREDRELPAEDYVFATRADAERWRDVNGLVAAQIWEVKSRKIFRWQPSRGTVRGIILADRLYVLLPPGSEATRDNEILLK